MTGCYKIYHTYHLMQMMNSAFKDHAMNKPACPGDLVLDQSREEKRGLVWREALMCKMCNYKSEMFKLYDEVETGNNTKGRRAATANVGLNVALMSTPIASTSAVKIFAGCLIPPPSVHGITKNARKVGKSIISKNRQDMKRRRKQLQKLNEWKGRSSSELYAQSDGMYNNPLYSGVGRTPFQPATQCTYTVAENMTQDNQIVAVACVNKLCSKHGVHTQEDECDVKSDECSCTLSLESNIGDEERWAELCFRDLKNDGLEVKCITTDGDSKAYKAATNLHVQNVTQTLPIHQLDTRHFEENHRKQMKNSPAVLEMMPGNTKAYRLYLRNRFALDLSKRCQAEFQAISEDIGGDLQLFVKKARNCIVAIKMCYGGRHGHCQQYSSVCMKSMDKNWFSKSIFLTNNFKINLLNPKYEQTLIECIEYRLGDDALAMTYLNSNTQKVEGTNRAIKRSVPNNVTFSRNYEARVHCAINSVNNGPGNSLRSLLEAAGCQVPTGGRVDTSLSALQRISSRKKQNERSAAFKAKRRARRLKLFALYDKNRETRNYIRAQLMRTMNKNKRKLSRGKTATKVSQPTDVVKDHSYIRSQGTNRVIRASRSIQSGACSFVQ